MGSDGAPALLVMTATINLHSNVVASDRNDPAVRIRDYCEALEYYLRECALIDRIVFIENSDSDLTALEWIANHHCRDKQVEFLSFYGQDYPAEYTKGYGELWSLDHAFRNSRLMSQLDDGGKCWKVTGRYLYADFRFRKKLVDVRLFSFSRDGYERLLLGRYPELTGMILEKYFFDRFAPLLEEKGEKGSRIIPELAYVPRIEGIGAFQNMIYMRGKLRLIYHARSALQFLKRSVRPRRWQSAAREG
jgi:hypothetical protein